MSKDLSLGLEKDVKVVLKSHVPKIKVGLDIGASSVKVSYMNDENISDFSFFNRIDHDVENGDGVIVNVDGEEIKVGSISGRSNANPKKVNYRYKKHILFNVAYQIKSALGIKGDIELDINTCLPPKQFKESREDYKQLIKDCEGTGVVNGEEFNLFIYDVKCGAEGVVLLKSFNINSVAKDLMKIMLLDIGSSTTDIILLENMTDNVWKIKNATTSTAAGSSMCKDIETHLNKTTDANYSWDNIELQGRYQLKQEVKPLINNSNDIDRTVKDLMNDIDKVGTFDEYVPLLAGQGSKILSQNDLFKKKTNFFVVDADNQKFGNSRGCLKA